MTIRRFRSVRGEIELSFPESGLMLLQAKNHDTGGSSGAGKSNFLEALAVLFGYSQYPSTENQNWDTEESYQVLGRFETDQTGSSIIQRGATKSWLQTGEQKVTGAKSIADGLLKVFGIGPDLMQALTYVPQDANGDFLDMPNAAKQEFLATLLNLQPFEDAVEIAQRNLVEKQRNLDAQQSKVSMLIDRLRETEKEFVAAQRHHFDLGTQHELKQWLSQVDAAEEKLKQCRSDLALENQRLDGLKTEKEAAVLVCKREHQTRLNAAQEHVRTIKAEAPASIDTTPEIARLENVLAIGRQKIVEVQQRDDVRRQEINGQISVLDMKLGVLRTRVKALPQLQVEVSKLVSEIARLNQDLCPTCERQWDAAHECVEKAESRLAQVRSEIGILDATKLQIGPLETERQGLATKPFVPDPLITQLQDGIANIRDQIATLRQEAVNAVKLKAAEHQTRVAEAERSLSEVRQQMNAAVLALEQQYAQPLDTQWKRIEQLRREQGTVQEQMLDIRRKVMAAESQDALALAAVESAKTNAGKYREAVREQSETLNRLKLDVAAEEDFIRMIGREGFLGAIFDEVLDEIGQETNAILGQVANTAHVVLDFVSESETQAGKVKKAISVQLTVGGRLATFKSGASGGMKSAIRLAVRLAIRRVISRRTGSFPGWLCLDECFNGLDNISKETCMEILAQAAHDDLILVVDHSSEFKELFTQSIVLEYRGGVTTLGQEE
jgi:DNA repair exonuclease SbcCD ATPase subunit